MTDLLRFPAGLSVLLQCGKTDCQAMDVDSPLIEPEAWGIASVSMQFQGETLLASLGFRFSASKPWGKECFKCFKEVPNGSQTVPDRTATDLLHFLSGLPVLFSWGIIDCQAVEFSSKWMKLEAGGIPGVSSHFLHKSKQIQMDLWQIYIDSHLDS